MKKAWIGTRYCWQHESKMYVVVAVALTTTTLLWTTLLREKVAPSAELRELRTWRAEATKLPEMRLGVAAGDDYWPIIPLTNDYLVFPTNVTKPPSGYVMVPIPPGKTNAQLSFSVRNISSVPADDVRLELMISDSLECKFSSSWKEAGPPAEGFKKRIYHIPNALGSGDENRLPAIEFFPGTNLSSFGRSVSARVRAKNSAYDIRAFKLYFYPSKASIPPYVTPVSADGMLDVRGLDRSR